MSETTDETAPATEGSEAPLRPEQFEQALAELEGLVERMEQGDQTLEESLRDFERGIRLSSQCGEALKAAEQRVATVTGDDDPGPDGA